MKELETLTLSIYRTFVSFVRTTAVFLGVSLSAAGAGATSLETTVAGTSRLPRPRSRRPPPRHERERRASERRAPRQRGLPALAEAKRRATVRTKQATGTRHQAAAASSTTRHRQILYEENSQDERSLASITKVMTAIVFLENATDLNEESRLREPIRCGPPLPICARTTGSDLGLLHLLLIPSDTPRPARWRASRRWATTASSRDESEGGDLGSTIPPHRPLGLYADNISSAYDMARLISFASEDDRIGPSCGRRSSVLDDRPPPRGPHRDRPQHDQILATAT